MPKQAAGLTARQVQTLKAAGSYADGRGLYLQVTETVTKSWLFRYQVDGRRRAMGLGPVDIVSLAEARRKVDDLRRLILDGVDPIEHRDRERAEAAAAEAASATPSFRACAEALLGDRRAGWKNAKHEAQWTATLETYAYPVIGDLPIDAIETEHVLRILQPIWATKTETASRVRGRVEVVLDAAKVRGLRQGENPARWRGHLALILPAKGRVAKVEHHRSMSYSDLPAFWPRLQVQDGMGARALEFCVLTAARTSEVIGARWDEIDFDAKVWTVPAERMKAGRPHRVPLSEPALALLRKVETIRMGDFVFALFAHRPISNMALLMMLRRMKAGVTAHGFRSTFRTWAAEKTAFQREVAEAALAHTLGDETEQAYQRGDFFAKRAKLMSAWAGFIAGGTGVVIPLTAGRAR